MNSTKKLTILLTLSGLVLGGLSRASAAAADDGTVAVAPMLPKEDSARGKRDGQRAKDALEQRLQQLDKALQLTAEQKTQIKEIWASEASTVVKNSKGGGRGELQAALAKTQAQVRAVLTPEQQKKFDKMQPEERGGRAAGKKAK
jgi:Spy/CpxP family protein refolding chaperone